MFDRCGRKIEYLRISVTQNCNLKCIYCKPGKDCSSKGCESLTPSDYKTIVSVMAGMGIRKVRITGGEPLLREDLLEIVEGVATTAGIEDISLTTNGMGLKEKARNLKKAGLKRVNISLDSLKDIRFRYITGGGVLQDALKGIEAAVEAGLFPVKLNTVLMKGVNEDEVNHFIRLAKNMPIDVRFIELMPVGRYGENNQDKIVYNQDVISAHPELIECEETEQNQPARYYRIEGYQGRIGFISPMSHKFCDRCNRIRLTCDGKMRPCLGDNGEVSIMETLRENPEGLTSLIESIIFNKPEEHSFETGFQSKRSMEAIGG